MSKLFSCYYDHNDMVKSRRNVNFGEMNIERLTEINDGFWLLWGILKEYIKQNIIMTVFKKANSD